MPTDERRPGRLLLRTAVLALVLLVALGGIVARLWSMQVRDHETYVRRGREMLTSSTVLLAPRGDIYDREGRALARSFTTYRLSVNPKRCSTAPAFYAALAAAAELPIPRVTYALSGQKGYRFLTKGLGRTRAEAVRRVARLWRADGVSLEVEASRLYPNGSLACHATGFVNSSGKALEGLELSLDDVLAGKPGRIEGPTDGAGYVLSSHRTEYVAARPGKDVRLTIDLEIQAAVTDALREAWKAHSPSTAVAIVMEPWSGDVLAMVSLPDYNPNDPGEALEARYDSPNSAPLRNSCVSLAFPPGSTFKVVTIAAGLDSGAITLETPTYCSGERQFGGRDTRCAGHEGSRAHGALDPHMAMVVSCNLSAGQYALMMGAGTFVKYIREFGCVDRPGTRLPGETKGLLPPQERWGNKENQLATMGFGQSIAVTPLALLTAIASLANDGRLVHARLVKSVDGKEQPIREGKQVVAPWVARAMMAMLVDVVEDERGTGHLAAVDGFRVAGKTGTAQRPDPHTRQMSHSLYDSYFVGFVPADRPRAAVLVMLDEPKNGYYGGAVAAPVFQKIAAYLITRWRLTPEAAQ